MTPTTSKETCYASQESQRNKKAYATFVSVWKSRDAAQDAMLQKFFPDVEEVLVGSESTKAEIERMTIEGNVFYITNFRNRGNRYWFH